MNTLAIDIGNTKIKAAIFTNNEISSQISFDTHDDLKIIKLTFEQWIKNFDVKHIGISNVGTNNSERLSFMYDFNECTFLNVNALIKLPFESKYETMNTLGADRICAICGALQKSKSPILVIDAGTAITYDYLSDKNEYLGGAISPGMRLRFKTLNDYTHLLPLLETQENFNFIGSSTKKCILSGVQSGFIFEIEGMINRYKLFSSENLNVFLTGGDSIFFQNNSNSNAYIFDPYLVLRGIHSLIQFNK